MSANATQDSPPMVNPLTFPPMVNAMVNALTSPPMVNTMVNGLTSPPMVNAMVNALTSPPTVNALTTLKKTCINWGKGESRDLLAKAIQDWLKPSFYNYICMENCRNLGDGSHGKKKWMANNDVLFARCVLACAAKENDGLSSKEV